MPVILQPGINICWCNFGIVLRSALCQWQRCHGCAYIKNCSLSCMHRKSRKSGRFNGNAHRNFILVLRKQCAFRKFLFWRLINSRERPERFSHLSTLNGNGIPESAISKASTDSWSGFPPNINVSAGVSSSLPDTKESDVTNRQANVLQTIASSQCNHQ
jgi:hypothetical protein